VQAARRRHVKNLLATLFLSQGVPMLGAGDEFGRTQRGNNNAYCQDNETAWVDWSCLDRNSDLRDFVRMLIAFRRAHTSLRRERFLRGALPEGGAPDVYWMGPEGRPPDWTHGRALGFRLDGRPAATGSERAEEHLLILVNAEEGPVRFRPPVLTSRGDRWSLCWTTGGTEEVVANMEEGTIVVGPRSVTVLAAP